MSDYQNDPRTLPAEKFCNPVAPLNPIKGDGALGNHNKGRMYYRGSDKEEQVKKVQRMLMALDHTVGDSGDDGDFGEATENAVINFQKENKDWNGEPLKVDGLVGPETADALNRRLVGVWYDRYDTLPALTDDIPHIAVRSGLAIAGIDIDAGNSYDVNLVIVDDRFKVISEDFVVLTKKLLNASSDFEVLDVVEVMQYDDGTESVYSFARKSHDVFIRPNVIVIGRFPKGIAGDALIRVVDLEGEPRCDWMECLIVDGPLRRKTIIPMGDKSERYTVALIANPGYGQKNAGAPFIVDDIMKDRGSFHRKVLGVLETFFDREEDLFQDPDIEPHMKFITHFDATLPADSDNSLIHLFEDSYIGPRNGKYPDAMRKFLNRVGIKADVVYAISYLARFQSSNFTIDGEGTSVYTFRGEKYSHGKVTVRPGWIADTVKPVFGHGSDMLVSMHEYFHAMSNDDHSYIFDLYDDELKYKKAINKREKAKKSDPIPEEFGEYQGVMYKSDRPDLPGYAGRGGLGYGPGSNGPIEKTYGPELRDKDHPSIMDDTTASANPEKCKIDTLTYQFVKDRIKAKLK